MAKQIINIGSVANDGTGDNLRVAGDKINDNFTELYDIAQAAGGAVNFAATSFSPVTYTGSESITSKALVFANKASTPFSLSMPNGTVNGEIKIFVNIGAATLTVNAVSLNLATPGGGSTFTVAASGSTILVWSSTASKWYMVSTDLNSTTIAS